MVQFAFARISVSDLPRFWLAVNKPRTKAIAAGYGGNFESLVKTSHVGSDLAIEGIRVPVISRVVRASAVS
jgi:hypothetical protein